MKSDIKLFVAVSITLDTELLERNANMKRWAIW